MNGEQKGANQELIIRDLQIEQLIPTDPKHNLLVENDLLEFLYRERLTTLYPDFSQWYKEKVMPGFLRGERLIHIVRQDNNIYGLSIVKLSPNETKLCNLVVDVNVRGKGIGRRLLESTLAVAKEVVLKQGYSPQLTATLPKDLVVPSLERSPLINFLRTFGFVITGELESPYRKGISEYVFTKSLI